MRRLSLWSILAVSVLFALGSATLAFPQLPPPMPVPTPLPVPLPTPPPLPQLPVSVPVTLSISGDEAVGAFDIGGIGADLKITFEDVVGLTSSALDVTATLVNPADPAIISRLPPGGLVGIPVAFPVVVRISPSASSALSFEGIYNISLHTHNLRLDPNVPFSLFKSYEGGPFKDITRSEGRGSYRDDGSGGTFSEFLIAIDFQDIDSVIAGKFDDLQALLTNNAGSITPDVLDTLQEKLSDARRLYQSGAIREAIGAIRVFSRYVKAHSGADIPDVWRANCSPLVNVAGLLRSGAETLRFSLDRKLGR
jgi:hypothetical protein